MFASARESSFARVFARPFVAAAFALGLVASHAPPARAQNPDVSGRWSQLFRIVPGNDWTGVHAALMRGVGDTTVIFHMKSDAQARALLIPPGGSLLTGPSGDVAPLVATLQADIGSTSGGLDHFCGGNLMLGDGTGLWVGGTE